MLSDFVKYVKQYWHDRPDKSTPLNADRLNHIENGIASNSEAINQIANAVVSNIVNDPEKIASMAAVYALQEKLGTGELPSDAPNAISAINTLYSNLIRNEVVSTTGVYLTRSGNVRLVKFISAPANSDGLIVTMSNDKPNRRTFAIVESMDASGSSPVISRVDIRTDGAIYLTDLTGNALNKVALGEILYTIA